MKKLTLFFFLLMFGALAVEAQTMRKLFVNIPDSVCPLLTKVNREDCIDFLDAQMRAQVKNRLNGTSELLLITDDYLKLQLTPSVTWEMKLLPISDEQKVICVVKTVAVPELDSSISFYNTSWEPLVGAAFIAVTFEGFTHATLSADDETLVLSSKLPQYSIDLNSEFMQTTQIEKCIKYTWRAGRFTQIMQE